MLKLGDKIINKLYLGDKKIAKVFWGDKLVYQAGEPIFLDYIEFDGKSYIDTGLFANSNWKVITVWETSTATKPIYGSYEGGKFFSAYVHGNWRFDGVPVVLTTDETPLNTKHTTLHDRNGVEVDGTLYPYQSTPNEFTASNLSFYVGTNNSANLGYYNGKIYSLAIWDSDVLILDFRPCIHPNGTVCFYDMVNKKYFYNQGTGTLTAGNKIKFVDYVTTDGNSYIDTGYCANENTVIEYTWETIEAPTASYNGLFGSRVATSNEEYHVFLQNGLSLRLDFGRYAEPTVYYKTTLNTKYTIKAGLGEIYINDELVKSYTPKQGQTKNSMYLGNFNNNGTPYTTGVAQKIYPCQIYENGVLVRGLRPCITNGIAGFYDMVTGKLFTNAGTGTLKASPRFVTSILFDGASYIDTGMAHQTCDIECDIRFEETGTRQLMGFGAGTGQYWGAGATGIFDYMNGTNALDRTLVVLNVDTTDITITVNADGVTRKSSKGSQVTQLTYRIGGAPTGVASTSYWCTCEVWRNKFKVDGVVIQDLRPYVDENNVACFKDVVTGNLFYNQGTGTLGYTE